MAHGCCGLVKASRTTTMATSTTSADRMTSQVKNALTRLADNFWIKRETLSPLLRVQGMNGASGITAPRTASLR